MNTLQHGYSVRSGLADPYFYPEEMRDLERRCTDPEFIAQLRANVTEKTHDIGKLVTYLIFVYLQTITTPCTTKWPRITELCMSRPSTKTDKWCL